MNNNDNNQKQDLINVQKHKIFISKIPIDGFFNLSFMISVFSL